MTHVHIHVLYGCRSLHVYTIRSCCSIHCRAREMRQVHWSYPGRVLQQDTHSLAQGPSDEERIQVQVHRRGLQEGCQ
jgi:hypothetical protein